LITSDKQIEKELQKAGRDLQAKEAASSTKWNEEGGKLGELEHTYNLSTWEAETGEPNIQH
jgi:hypothetical protein